MRTFVFAILTALVCRGLQAADAPNIIFIEVDDLCYTYAGPWGSKIAKTPTLDRLAAKGFVFDQAMCQGMMCGPSRNCLMSAKYPHQLGFYQNGDMKKLPETTWTLPAALHRAGYQTAYIGKSHLKPYFVKTKRDPRGSEAFNPFFGFDYSLHTLGRVLVGGDDGEGKHGEPNPYMEHLAKRGLLEQYQADDRAKRNSTLPEDDYLDGWFTKNVIDYVAAYDAKKPLFMWINFSVPHGPYDVPDPYHQPFETAPMPGVTKPTNFEHPASLIERTKTVKSEEDAIAAQRGFCANIYFMDTQVGRILDALDARDLFDDAWIVFFSDQGVMEGAQGLVHKNTLFRQVTQPSLIVRAPQGRGGAARIDAPVELMDLLPTFLEVAGITSEKSPAGVSLLPLFAGGETSRTYAFGEIADWIVVSDGHYRLIRSVNDEPPLLFDDVEDPENLTNLADKRPKIVKSLGAAIDQWLADTGPRLSPQNK